MVVIYIDNHLSEYLLTTLEEVVLNSAIHQKCVLWSHEARRFGPLENSGPTRTESERASAECRFRRERQRKRAINGGRLGCACPDQRTRLEIP